MIYEIKQTCRKLARFVLKIFGIKNIVIFESLPSYTDSVKCVFDEMVRRGLDKKYTFVWLTIDGKSRDGGTTLQRFKTVNKITQPKSYRFIQNIAIAAISSNDRIELPKFKNRVSSFYIAHGTPIKTVRSYYNVPNEIERFIVASKNVIPLMSYEFDYPQDRMVGLGLPRNDALLENSLNLNELFSTDSCKFVVWYPTFRRDPTVNKENSLPLIHDIEIAKKLNEYARTKGIIIVFKPHFVQLTTFISDLELSNIQFIDDDFFFKHGITSYQFVGSCDALISDYSSVVYDFLLCDKPVGLVWEDVANFRKEQGFAPDVEKYLECGHKIYDLDGLLAFLDIVLSGDDPLKEIRNKIKEETNQSLNPDNTRRVTDYIIEQAKL